jgi:hypothetical protein
MFEIKIKIKIKSIAVAESLLESLALLKKADVEPTEKFTELNKLPTFAKQLYADPAFDLEQTIPCKVFVKWYAVTTPF